MDRYFGEVWMARLVVQRGMAALYFVAFLNVALEFKPLLGERGLLPVRAFTRRLRFGDAPGIFTWKYSDRGLDAAAWTGLLLSACALGGLTERGPWWASVAAWLVLWALYLSVVNVGQKFYGFGWESMLLEAGFFAAFLGPARIEPSILPLLILRWMLFRTEVGAGLIKLRHDPCWRDLTCLYYHYETQPLPNPLSWWFHRLPKALHRFAVVVSHGVQVAAPFALFAPQPVAEAAAALIIVHQLWLIVSGNYSWLNWLTAVLGFAGLSDGVLRWAIPVAEPAPAARPHAFELTLWVIAAGTVLMSVPPALNLISRKQAMNRNYNPFHLVSSYGAFGRVGRERYEIVLEGTNDGVVTPATEWKEYGFKAKPGEVRRMPPQIAPYHLRLDWLVWFLPFSVVVTGSGIRVPGHPVWFLRLVKKLLEGDRALLGLMGKNPFGDAPPKKIRALFYQYRFTTAEERRATGAWWARRLLGVYLEPVGLEAVREL
jgi:hypothetical protein